MRSSFGLALTPTVAILNDLDAGMSITNDAENVVAFVLQRAREMPDFDPNNFRIIYQDTSGTWDELLHDGKRMIGFRIMQKRTMDEALEAVGIGRQRH